MRFINHESPEAALNRFSKEKDDVLVVTDVFYWHLQLEPPSGNNKSNSTMLSFQVRKSLNKLLAKQTNDILYFHCSWDW